MNEASKLPMPVKVVAVIALGVCMFWIGFKLAFPDVVRARSSSLEGNYAEVLVEGVPLSAGTRLLVWTNQSTHWQAFACKLMEAHQEQPIKLQWEGSTLVVHHAYKPAELIDVKSSCGSIPVTFRQNLKRYS